MKTRQATFGHNQGQRFSAAAADFAKFCGAIC